MFYSIYMIFCDTFFYDNGCKSIYIGSTKEFDKRKNFHKRCCNNSNYKFSNYKLYNVIKENGGWNNWNMIELEYVEYNNKKAINILEQKYIQLFNSDLNTQNAYVSIEDKKKYKNNWYKQLLEKTPNFNKIKYKKELEKNPNHIKEQYEKYKEKNLQKYICNCDIGYTFNHKKRHEKSKHHCKWLLNQ
jgi:hypothetical protein